MIFFTPTYEKITHNALPGHQSEIQAKKPPMMITILHKNLLCTLCNDILLICDSQSHAAHISMTRAAVERL